MTSPSEWEEADLLELIRLKTEENLRLDFKEAGSLGFSDKKKTDIAKDVSALANSAGGTIVYGIVESQIEPHSAESLSPINPAEYPKEWLEQIINSRIDRRIPGVFINPVSVQAGGVVYVVCVPQSATVHQASDHRSYKRFNFQSVPMEDYEVRLTLNRTSTATYAVKLRAMQVGNHNSVLSFRFQADVENISELLGRDVSATLLVPKHLVHNPGPYEITVGDAIYTRIPGTWPGTVPSGIGTPTNLPPFSPRPIYFERELTPPHPESTTPLRVFVRMFDRNGPALTAEPRPAQPDTALRHL